MKRAALAVCVAVLAVMVAPLAVADPVVDAQVTAVKSDDGTITADIHVINTGPDAVTLKPVVPADPGCLPTADPTSVAGSQSATVTVAIPSSCFADDSTPIALDLDGAGARHPLPATRVVPPKDEASNWAPLWWGVFIGLLMAIAVGLRGWTEHEAARATVIGQADPANGQTREQAYAAVQEIVDARWRTLPVTAIEWKDLDPPEYDLTSPIGNLEAGWSFKDSWVSNVTVASSALIALLTSTDALTAVLGQEPKAALGVMTVGGLVAAVVIGLANTLVKLVGSSVTRVTVGGLILSTSLVVFAAGLQITTVALAVAGAVAAWPVAAAAVLLAVVVGAVLMVYAFRSLGQAITKGFADSLPVVPATALSDWAATDDWEARIVAASIRATFAPWLVPDTIVPAPDAVLGMDYWTPVAQPPTLQMTRSLL